MSEIRYKTLPFEVKAVDEAGRIIEGYAAAFDNTDSYGDVLLPGCFTKTLEENAHRVKVAWQHMWWEVIGVPRSMEQDRLGLFTRSYISRTQRGNEALILAADGAITEMSIGYEIVPGKYTENDHGGFDIAEVKLWEYSLVTFAANQAAVVTGVKGAGFAELLRNLTPDNLDPAATKAAIEVLQALQDGREPAQATPAAGAATKDDEPATGHSADADLALEAMALRSDANQFSRKVLTHG